MEQLKLALYDAFLMHHGQVIEDEEERAAGQLAYAVSHGMDTPTIILLNEQDGTVAMGCLVSHMFASTAEIGPVNCLVPQVNVPVVIRVVSPVVPPAICQLVADGGVLADDETSES